MLHFGLGRFFHGSPCVFVDFSVFIYEIWIYLYIYNRDLLAFYISIYIYLYTYMHASFVALLRRGLVVFWVSPFVSQLSNEEVLSESELLAVLQFLLGIAAKSSVEIGIRQQALSPIHWAAKQKPRGKQRRETHIYRILRNIRQPHPNKHIDIPRNEKISTQNETSFVAGMSRSGE